MRQRCLVAAILPLALALASCGDDDGDSEGGGEQVYKVGVATGQTGYLATTDRPTLRGLELGVDEINEAGGIDGTYEIELDIQNTGSDPGRTATVVRQLIEDDAKLIVTPCDQDPSVAGGEIAQQEQVPAISFCATTPTLPDIVGDYMFSNAYGDNITGTILGQYARELEYETGQLHLSPETAYTQKLPEYFGEVFEANDGEVLGETTFELDQQEFGADLTNLNNLSPQPDVLFTSAYAPTLPAFLQQYRSAGVEIPFFAAEGMDTEEVLGLPKNVIEGVVYTTNGFPQEDSPLAEFNEKYEAEHGKDPDSTFPAVGYDLAKVIEAAVTEAGTDDPTAVRDALAGLENVEGATGPITYAGTNGMPIKRVALMQIKNGEPELIRYVEPEPDDVPEP
jgi:branched-chain amino acid transport system substrate-binding protein